jgi:hypothetical protein
MKGRLILALLALNAWLAVSLPIYTHRSNQAAGITAPHNRKLNYDGPIPVMKASSSSKHGPHFLEWLAESKPEQRNALLRVEALRPSSHRGGRDGNWMDGFRKMMKTWSTFYGTQYPTKPVPSSYKHSSMESPCAVIVDASTAAAGESAATYCPPPSSPHQSRHKTGFIDQILRSLKHMDIAAVCSEYGTEIVALCIFLLVPITVILVEVIDMLHDRWVPEQYPERGRRRVRLTGPERQLSVMEKWEREKMVRGRAQTFWGSTKRGSKNS